ncbi:MAG: acyltransferase [Planctomycetia bacterium]|nr:acyltransferase [Planctomycetia bacterium]
MSFYAPDELATLGLRSCGEHVLISRKASLYNAGAIEIGSHVRIDDFCVLSAGAGGITIGSFVHVAVYVSMIGAGRITLGDYSCLSGRVSIYSSNDDYSGIHLTNPMVPDRYRGVVSADVVVGRHALVGAGSVVLPGVTIGEGAAIGAMSFVRGDCAPFGIHAGVPARLIKARSRRLLDLEALHQADLRRQGGA